jgi:hypothetical protein
VTALAARLADPEEHPAVRCAAVWALAQIGTARAQEALRGARDCAYPDLRQAITSALERTDATREQVQSG